MVLKYVAGLAIERLTDSLKRREAYCLSSTILKYGEVCHGNPDFFGQFGNAHLALSQHDVDVNNHCHMLNRQIVFGLNFDRFMEELLQHRSKNAYN